MKSASEDYSGDAIFILGGRYSAHEISAANDQLVSAPKDKFTNTLFNPRPGARNPRPKMPVTVELPLQKLAQAKSIEEVRTIFNTTIKESIFAALKTYPPQAR